MTDQPAPHCPAAPTGEGHRWRIPNQGASGLAVCKWCGLERVFTPDLDGDGWRDLAHQRRIHSRPRRATD